MNGELVNSEWESAESFDSQVFSGFAEDGERVTDYRDLDVWKLGMGLSSDIYRVTVKFPTEERHGITSQMRRASVSVPTNVAEGYGRETTGAFIQFLRIAQGSLKELETLIELSRQLGFLANDVFELLREKTVRLSKMLRGLIRALERRNA